MAVQENAYDVLIQETVTRERSYSRLNASREVLVDEIIAESADVILVHKMVTGERWRNFS